MKLATCVRHWDREAVGLFKVAGSPFGISSWMCAQCVDVRAYREEVARRRRLSMAERKTIGE